ncbi:unnamed protein product [Vicia faba]|uniref:Uncharacterized protein n=1 Tax=Vicia faba TaxID=3906 RepID=A0AAV0ZTT9_VICFA|nr:unnamed protein product [Vicia faba]
MNTVIVSSLLLSSIFFDETITLCGRLPQSTPLLQHRSSPSHFFSSASCMLLRFCKDDIMIHDVAIALDAKIVMVVLKWIVEEDAEDVDCEDVITLKLEEDA